MRNGSFILLGIIAATLYSGSVLPGGRKRTVEESEKKQQESVQPTQPIPTPAISPSLPRIGFDCVECNSDEKKQLKAAESILASLVKGQCFKDFMLKRKFIWRKPEGSKSDLTNQEIYDKIINANLTVPVHYYYKRFSSVVGYREPPDPDIYFNRKFHDYYSACDTASNAFHEWSHTLGFDHPFNPTNDRGYTVPYSLNTVVEQCCESSNGYRGNLIELKGTQK